MIVITGGAGFIGSALVWKFNERGATDILVVDQLARNTPKWNNLKNLRFSQYMESDEFLSRVEADSLPSSIEAVFHMGACSDTTEMNRAYLNKNNFEYTKTVADWCVEKGVYLAYASSAAVYGDGLQGFSDDDAKTPSFKPLNPYGQSKLDFDVWALKKGYHRLITGFRYFNVYGPNEAHKAHMRSMVFKGYEQIRDTGKLKLFKSYLPEYPDGGQKRDFVYIKDVVDVMLWFYEHPTQKGILNLGTGHAATWNDLAQALFKACGRPPKIGYIEMPDNLRSQYQYFTEANLTKLKATGCPSLTWSLDNAVEDYVRCLLQNGGYLR